MYRSLPFFLVFLLLFWRCGQERPAADTQTEAAPAPAPAAVPDSDFTTGKTLSAQHCGSCHLLPSPELLDKTTWTKKVLPNMGARLGLRLDGYNPFEGVDPEELAKIKALNIYPEEPQLSEEEWTEIVTYYETLAPQQLPEPQRTTVISSSPPPFLPNLVEIGDKQMPEVTLLKYDNATGRLFIGDGLYLYALDRQGAIAGNWQTQSPSSDIAPTKDGILLLSIGRFNPSERMEGAFFPLTLENKGRAEDYTILDLPRPVQFAIGDLNGDRRDDVLICGFGNHQGQLAWYDQFKKEKAHVLSTLPGARKAVIRDLNGDGRNDITVLMAQAWEKVVVYYNTGNGNFREETVITLPAIYGASYFELQDFNEDGFPDILLTNGDNWDYSGVPKPYHGLRVYLNDGANHFSEAYFYPMYGCSEARAVDFDRDGDLDIAAIAFYSDQAAGSFVYLENDGAMGFTAYYMNETSCGKWLRMEVGDFNSDGYPDIFLGSYFHNFNELSKLMVAGVKTFPEVLLLTYQRPEE